MYSATGIVSLICNTGDDGQQNDREKMVSDSYSGDEKAFPIINSAHDIHGGEEMVQQCLGRQTTELVDVR